jgi:hypothetical protein
VIRRPPPRLACCDIGQADGDAILERPRVPRHGPRRSNHAHPKTDAPITEQIISIALEQVRTFPVARSALGSRTPERDPIDQEDEDGADDRRNAGLRPEVAHLGVFTTFPFLGGVWNKKAASQYCDPSSHFGNGDLIYVFKHRELKPMMCRSGAVLLDNFIQHTVWGYSLCRRRWRAGPCWPRNTGLRPELSVADSAVL